LADAKSNGQQGRRDRQRRICEQGNNIYGSIADCGETDNSDNTGEPQSSIIALADGATAGMVHCGDQSPPADKIDPQNTAEARVMRLRGYGNSLVSPAADAFIRAVMEEV
jgi:hypothetical protein